MKNLTGTFKTIFIVYIALFLLGVIVSCIFGINTFATLGKGGQQLVYDVSGDKDNYDAEIDAVKSYLKDNGATMIVAQTSYDAFDKADSLIFTFKSNKNLESKVVVSGVECQVSDINTKQAGRAVGSAAIGLGVALVLVFAYMAFRHLRNNWMSYALGSVCTVLMNSFAMFGLVQLAGLAGYQFDSSITSAFLFVMVITVVMFVMTMAFAGYKAELKKVAITEEFGAANNVLGGYYWSFAVMITAVVIVLSVLFGGAFVIKLVPIAIAAIICALSAVTIAPIFWRLFSRKDEQTVAGK